MAEAIGNEMKNVHYFYDRVDSAHKIEKETREESLNGSLASTFFDPTGNRTRI